MSDSIRTISICTGGGDAPGLNAVIRAAVSAAHKRGWQILGIRDGYNGLLDPGAYPSGGVYPLTRESVRGITHLGGTILGTTNKGNPLRFPVHRADGSVEVVNRTGELVDAFKARGIDAHISIGGDGSMEIANALGEAGLKIVGVPKTIDNDLDGTVVTFGFDTAVSFATECIDRLHSTAQAHQRVMVVEVMGRYAGWIALESGVAGSADVILMPEIPFTWESVFQKIRERDASGRLFSIVVVAEGAKAVDGQISVKEKEVGKLETLGGVGELVSAKIRSEMGRDTRCVVLGHLLRGGTPSTFDRLLGLRFGAAAVRALETGHYGVLVALDPPVVKYVPLAEATHRMKTVPLDCDTVQTARDLGICLGD